METNLLHLQNLNQQVAQAVAAALAQAQVAGGGGGAAGGSGAGATGGAGGMIQLQPQNIPLPHARVKATHPKPFTSDRHKTRVFMQSCENYFALTPNMTDKEQIRFTLQLIEGDAKFWKETTLDDMD